MKALVRNFMVFMLLAPAYAQMPSIPFRDADSNLSGEPAISKKQAQKSSEAEVQKEEENAPVAQIPSIPLQNAENNAGAEAATAEEPIQKPSAEEFQEADMHAPLFRTIGGLGLVVFLMIAIYFAAKKFAPQYFRKSSSEKTLKVIETLSMGDKRSISLIEVANNRFLVGNTPHQINLLAALPEAAGSVSEPEALSAQSIPTINEQSQSPFRNLFEVEKKRPPQYMANPLPEDIRTKMRRLREALER